MADKKKTSLQVCFWNVNSGLLHYPDLHALIFCLPKGKLFPSLTVIICTGYESQGAEFVKMNVIPRNTGLDLQQWNLALIRNLFILWEKGKFEKKKKITLSVKPSSLACDMLQYNVVNAAAKPLEEETVMDNKCLTLTAETGLHAIFYWQSTLVSSKREHNLSLNLIMTTIVPHP